MHKKIPVEIKTIKSLPIVVGAGITSNLSDLFNFNEYSSLILVTDATTDKLYGRQVTKALKATGKRVLILTFPAGERSKSLKQVERGYQFLIDNGVDRSALLCVLGGGVVGDVGGYIASTYLRGIDYIQLPTTLLAQVDSSIGGKVGINFSGKKNMVGSFYQPRAIISDIAFLESLPTPEMRNGMAEVIKYGLAMDKELFDTVSGRGGEEFTASELTDIIERCSFLKARVVEADETDRSGLRSILNFGHTVGHAVEATTRFRRQHHGEAVAIGMVAATKISERLGMLNRESVHKVDKVLTKFGLPTRCPKIPPRELVEAMQFDKKATQGQLKWVLLEGIGRGVVNCTVEADVVTKVLTEVCQ
jgi:3-dehydroquinate synthase